MKETIRKKNYNLVTNSSKFLKELNQKLIFKNIDNDLTKLYLDHLESSYTLSEIKLMKQTLESGISTKSAIELNFIAVLSIVMLVITTFVTLSIGQEIDLTLKVFLIAFLAIGTISIVVLLIIDFFLNQYLLNRRVKLLNHFNLMLALKKSCGDDK